MVAVLGTRRATHNASFEARCSRQAAKNFNAVARNSEARKPESELDVFSAQTLIAKAPLSDMFRASAGDRILSGSIVLAGIDGCDGFVQSFHSPMTHFVFVDFENV